MILALDVGNSNIVVGCMEGREAVRVFRLVTRPEGTAAEYEAELRGHLTEENIAPDGVEGVILSSVVPPVTAALRQAAENLTGKAVLVVGENVRHRLDVRIRQPETLAGDLLCGAVGALDLYQPPLLLIDMGTATTISVLDGAGAFRGGAILPGVKLSLSSLAGGTALLPDIPLAVPERAIGDDTVTCMQSGCVLGAAALLDGMIQRMEQELGQPVTVIATGGLAPVLVPACRREMVLADDLILRGLAVLYQQNK